MRNSRRTIFKNDALNVYFPLLRASGFLCQSSEAFLEVVSSCSDIPWWAFVVLQKMLTQNTVGERGGGSATNGKEALDVRTSDLLFEKVVLVEEENLAMATL